jgi:arylsulfatase A-like enzyme
VGPVLAFCWVTALYAFIASSAFAYLQFIRPRVFWWLGAFSDWHWLASWVWLAALGVVLWPRLRNGHRSTWAARSLAASGFLLVVLNTAMPVVPSLHEGGRSVVVGVVALFPVLALALVDHLDGWPFLRMRQAAAPHDAHDLAEGRLFVTAIGSAFVLTAAYAVLTSLSLAGAFEPDLDPAALALGAATTLLDHLLVFGAAFVSLAAILRIGGASVARQYVLLLAAVTVLFAALFATLVGGSIGLANAAAWTAAIVTGLSIACTWGGMRLARHARSGARLTAATDVFLAPPVEARPGNRSVAALAAVLLLAWVLAQGAARMDWDFALLQAGVVIVWLTTFALVHSLVSPGSRPAWLVLAVCGGPIVMHAAWHPERTHAHVLDRYTVYNPSFRLADRLLREHPGSSAFDRFLRANTGLTDLELQPRSIDIVPAAALAPATTPPDVFLLVVDSLRSDYLSPYNAKVRFTPHIDAFARANVPFRNAFTAYGGTGLSMPAIWAGSALAHKQYVLPFAPMNALGKLLDANGYARMMTGGYINETLWPARPDDIRLQSGEDEMAFGFCSTVEEIGQRLEQRASVSRPVFAQTLSQDLHVATIRNAYVPPDRSYPGFNAPYAYRVERIDACFGAFIDTLKRLGLYDRSLVVLTADHGDLLGEDGRWGHSYHLYPQVIQVPLLLHLPAGVELAAGRDEAVYSTDITPTIYAALGYAPVPKTPLAGRALARRGGAPDRPPPAKRTDAQVIAASYGAVYAVVSHGGHRLYIADAIQEQEHAYARTSLDDLAWSDVPLDAGTRVRAQLRIRRHIDAISADWGIGPRF